MACRSGSPPAKLTIARRVQVTWSSHSLRIASWKASWRAVSAWLEAACSWVRAIWPSWAAAAAGARAVPASSESVTAGIERRRASRCEVLALRHARLAAPGGDVLRGTLGAHTTACSSSATTSP